jgi:SAM-dependent methyltransferase
MVSKPVLPPPDVPRRAVPPLSLHAWLRYDAIERLLPPEARTLLEVGAGQGSLGALLARRLTYVGLEPDEAAFSTALRRIGTSGRVENRTVENYRSADRFDVVCAFEVLEHMQDDVEALAIWRGHLREGGWLLVSVPAGTHRFGPTDVKAGHYRRYDRRDLVELLAKAHFEEVEIITYGFPLGYVLEAARNLYARRTDDDTTQEARTASSGRWLQPPEWAGLVLQVASAPFRYAQRPFGSTGLGTGLVARARKR